MYPVFYRKKTHIPSTTPLLSDNIYPIIKNPTNITQKPDIISSYKNLSTPHNNHIVNNNTKPHNN